MSFSSGNSSLPLLTQQMPLGLAIRFVPLRTTHMNLPAAHAGPQSHPLRPPWYLHVRFCHEQEAGSPNVNAAAATPMQASAKKAGRVCSVAQASPAAQVAETCPPLSSAR